MHTDVRESIGHRSKRQDFDQTVSRKHYLSNQDVRNIRRSVVDGKIKRHENDATSVDILVRELQQEPFNPILIYKPQGVVNDEYPTISKDSFIVAVQTEFQVDLYRKFSSKILCIDATHSTNAYRFKLITCIVPDDFGQGMWCYTRYKNSSHTIQTGHGAFLTKKPQKQLSCFYIASRRGHLHPQSLC